MIEGASQSELEEVGIAGAEYEMTEQRSSSQLSLDTDDFDETKFSVTAKPSETCRYASQLRGDLPALSSNYPLSSMCDDRTVIHPLRLTADDIPADIGSAGINYGSSPRVPLQRTSLSKSSSSVSPGGTHRHRKQPTRTDSMSSWSSLSPGGSRRVYHRSSRHRPDSLSSWSSISPNGTRRHRRRMVKQRSNSVSSRDSVSSSEARRRSINNFNRDSLRSSTRDHQMPAIRVDQQMPAYAAAPETNRDFYLDIQKQDAGGVYAPQPKPDSATSSNSSIPSLYGRVVFIGQSPDFRTRIQSFRKKMATPKKSKHSRGSRGMGENGYDFSSSDSSISSISSDKLPPEVVKVRGGEYAVFDGAGETIFEERPRKKEDTYANCMFGQLWYFKLFWLIHFFLFCFYG